MASTRKPSRVQDIIVRAGIVDDLQVRSTNSHLDKWGGSFAAAIVQLGFADEDEVTETIGKGLNMPVMHLGTLTKDPNALAKLTAEYCEENLVFPISFRDRTVSLAMVDPTMLDIIDDVQMRASARVSPQLSSATEIRNAISRLYRNIEIPRGSTSRARKAFVKQVTSTNAAHAPGQVTAKVAALKGRSANSMLNEMFGEDVTQLGPNEMARLKTALETQEKAGHILRALKELLASRGIR